MSTCIPSIHLRSRRDLSLLNLDRLLLIILISFHDASESTNGSSAKDNLLDADDVASMSHPVESGISEHIDESNEWDDVGDSGIHSVCDSSLYRWKDRSSRNPHDEDAGTAASVTAKVGRAESEESRVHGSLEEEKEDEDDYSALAIAGNDDGIENDCANGVYHQEEIGLEDSG